MDNDHPPFPGVLVVDDETFDRLEADLKKPGKPSATVLKGAEFLRQYDEMKRAPKLRH